MLSGHRPAWRRRSRNSRAARIAVPLAIPMALGLTLGIVLAVSGGPVTTINQSALGDCNSPSASPAASGSPAASASASASACPSASASTDPAVNAVVPPAATFSSGHVAFFPLGDLATDPVDGTGAAIDLNQTAAEAANSMNCTLTVPNNPLSARGLATPYQLGDGCTMADAVNEGAFVEATILAPNGSLQVYNPLVITAGTTPAATPVVPHIARGSTVIIDVGSNGNNLVLEGRGARQGNCVDALGQSVIGQVSACNAVNFYRVANAAIRAGFLQVPALGTSDDGQACLSTRNFGLVDQDQSDNVISAYLINANGQTAQDTAANANGMTGATTIANGSDDRLLAEFVDPANGCTPFTATDTTASSGASASQALNELSARVNQTGTIGVTPVNDEMALVNSAFSVAKTNVYRSLVDQPLLPNDVNTNDVAADYCQNMVNTAPARNQLDMTRELNFASPVPATGDNLATFMGARLAASFGVLGCANFGLMDPVNVTTNGAGVATAVTYSLVQQTANASGTGGGTSTATPTASPVTSSTSSTSSTASPTTSSTATAPATSPTSPTGSPWWWWRVPANPWARWFGSRSPWSFAPPRRHGHHQNETGM
jgi:hypothetical protein